jgi:hypothetical protein
VRWRRMLLELRVRTAAAGDDGVQHALPRWELFQLHLGPAVLYSPNVVITSLDLEPVENAYAVSWVQTTQPGGFDYRRDPVVPAGTGQQAQIQAQATLDGKESRIVTAVSFDASGNAILISYGWTGDTTTAYETQTIMVAQQNQISSAVSSAATTPANAGYFISASPGPLRSADWVLRSAN